MITWLCLHCGAEFNSSASFLPRGWVQDGSATICPDCTVPAAQPLQAEAPEPLHFVSGTFDHVRHGYFATFMPNRAAVAFHFPRGVVEFSVDEAEAISLSMLKAVTIAKGEHPAQTARDATAPRSEVDGATLRPVTTTAGQDLSGASMRRAA